MSKLWKKYTYLWNESSGYKRFFFFGIHYTLIYFFLTILIFLPLWEARISLCHNGDAICQYMTRLIYISRTFRDSLQDLLNGGGWTFPLYDFRTGAMPNDLQVEPLQWTAVLWPWDRIDVLYDLLIYIRVYLVGISFSIMGFEFRQKQIAVLIGSVCYAFSGFTIFQSIFIPELLAAMIYLPLLVAGTEKIIKGKKNILFLVTVFAALCTSLYYSCQIALIIIIYMAVRLFFIFFKRKNAFRNFTKMLGKIMLQGVIGVFLSGIVVIPTLIQMLGTGRIGRSIGEQWLHFSVDEYETFFSSFMLLPNSSKPYGFSVILLPMVILLFVGKGGRKRNTLRTLFVVLTIMVCIPAVSYIMSGFNAVHNRWYYAYILCCSAIVMLELPRFKRMNKKKLLPIFSGMLIFIIIFYFIIDKKNYHEELLIFILALAAGIGLCYAAGAQGRRAVLAVCLCFTCLSSFYWAYLQWDPNVKSFSPIHSMKNKDEIYKRYEEGQYSSLGNNETVKNDDSFFRVSGSLIGMPDCNMALYWDLNGLSYYGNNNGAAYKDMRKSLELVSARSGNHWNSEGSGNAPFLTLQSVKYYAARKNSPVPYGFYETDRQSEQNNSFDIIYENKYALPIGYTYDYYIKRDKYEQYTAAERQEVMVQSIVIEDIPTLQDISENAPDTISAKIDAEITESDGVTYENGDLKVTKENATLTLTFKGMPNADTYVRLINFDLAKGMSSVRCDVTVSADKITTYAHFDSDGFLYSSGEKTQMLYLGNYENGCTSCTLKFSKKGNFTLDGLEIWCTPMDSYAKQIEVLRQESLENVETNWRGLSGTISVSKNKMLCLSIPYEDGWKAYVDGKETALLQANIGMMAIELPEGEHTVEIRYWMPGLTLGIVLSVVGFFGIIVFVFLLKKEKLYKKQ